MNHSYRRPGRSPAAGLPGASPRLVDQWRAVSYHEPMPRRVKISIAVVIVTILVMAGLLILGCAPRVHVTRVPNSLPAVGGGLDKAQAHVESAERATVAAKPIAGKNARPLLEQVSAEHAATLTTLKQTGKDVSDAERQRDQVIRQNEKLAGQLNQIVTSTGYRALLWIKRIFYTGLALAAFHVIGRIAAVFIPPPFGAALALASTVVNPFGWVQSAADNYFFRVKAGGGGGGA